VVVEENGLLVGENKEVAVRAQVRKRVQVVLDPGVVGLCQEREVDGALSCRRFGNELVIELAATSDHDHALVRQDLVGRVPSWYCERIGELMPVVCGSTPNCAHHPPTVVPSAGLSQVSTR